MLCIVILITVLYAYENQTIILIAFVIITFVIIFIIVTIVALTSFSVYRPQWRI